MHDLKKLKLLSSLLLHVGGVPADAGDIKYLIAQGCGQKFICLNLMPVSSWLGLGRWAPWTGAAPCPARTPLEVLVCKIILIELHERSRLFGAADDQSSIGQRPFVCSVAIPVHQTWYYTKNNFLDFMANVVWHFLKVQKRSIICNIYFTLDKKWGPWLSS